jgi:hypothetical protein
MELPGSSPVDATFIGAPVLIRRETASVDNTERITPREFDAKSQRCPQGSYTSASCKESYLQADDAPAASVPSGKLQEVGRTDAGNCAKSAPM